jgi:hypothetical protein
MTIRHAIFIGLLVVTGVFFAGAWLNEWSGVQGVFLPIFLSLLAVLIAHDAYGNRLLPRPNFLAQIAGYLEAAWCVALAAVLLWNHVPP